MFLFVFAVLGKVIVKFHNLTMHQTLCEWYLLELAGWLASWSVVCLFVYSRPPLEYQRWLFISYVAKQLEFSLKIYGLTSSCVQFYVNVHYIRLKGQTRFDGRQVTWIDKIKDKISINFSFNWYFLCPLYTEKSHHFV